MLSDLSKRRMHGFFGSLSKVNIILCSSRMNQVIRWSNNDILINNSVRIVDPYRADNVSIDASTQSSNAAAAKLSAKGDNDTKTHIMKLVTSLQRRAVNERRLLRIS